MSLLVGDNFLPVDVCLSNLGMRVVSAKIAFPVILLEKLASCQFVTNFVTVALLVEKEDEEEECVLLECFD